MIFARAIAKESGRDFSRPVTEGSDMVALAAKSFVNKVFQERESKKEPDDSNKEDANIEDPLGFVVRMNDNKKESKEQAISMQIDKKEEYGIGKDPLAFLDDWDEEKERPKGFENRWKAREALSS